MSNGKIKIIELSEDALEQKLDDAREEGWRFANDCYVKPLPVIAEWLECEKRYPHGMTYAEARRSYEKFQEEKAMQSGIVIWGEKLPSNCSECFALDAEFSDCYFIDYKYSYGKNEGRPEACPLNPISREDLKE